MIRNLAFAIAVVVFGLGAGAQGTKARDAEMRGIEMRDAEMRSTKVLNCGVTETIDIGDLRLVVHDLNMTEMVVELGLSKHLVGVSGLTGFYSQGLDVLHSLGEVPEIAQKNPSLENILSVDPDIFFAGWYYGMRPGGEVTPDSLAQFGIETLVLTESCSHLGSYATGSATMSLLYDDVIRLGQVFDREQAARSLIAAWKNRIEQLPSQNEMRAAPRVFLYDSGADKPFTAGKFAIPTALIETAGGQNVADDLEISWGTTSWESIAASDPEMIILLDYQFGSGADRLQALLEDHPLMSGTKAVREKNYIKLRYEQITPGPSNIDAIEQISSGLVRFGLLKIE